MLPPRVEDDFNAATTQGIFNADTEGDVNAAAEYDFNAATIKGILPLFP